VEGGMGDNTRPITTRKWGEEDDKGVMELRKELRERMKVRTIEEMVGECETGLRSENRLVARVEDGTRPAPRWSVWSTLARIPSHRGSLGPTSTS
jgi:hypothetical protein